MPPRRIGASLAAGALMALLAMPAAAAADPAQHGPGTGHLTGAGEWGVIKHLKTVKVTSPRTGEAFPDLVADVAVDPHGEYAYLAHWGEQDCDANSEAGGTNTPDAGAWVIDIDPIADAREVGFIPASQDSRPGEGMQVEHISTKFFNGHMLVMNNEQCGKNGKGGISLYDVTNPRDPKKLSENHGDRGWGDTNEIHAAFAWDTGAKAYAVMVDNVETTDVDILDITNPKRPKLIGDFDVNGMSRALGDPVFQPELGLDDSGLHDMVVKKIGGDWIMLLSYWDGGYVQLNVNDPANPEFINDTDYAAVDPELADPANGQVPAGSRDIPPEGNAHQAEFTGDNEMFIGTDEDFSPFRPVFEITTGPNTGQHPAGEFGWTPTIDSRPGKSLTGTTVFTGYGCPGSPAIAHADTTGVPDGQQVAVMVRGPVQDPSANYEACYFSEKVEAAQNAGYDAVLIANHHVGAQRGDAADAKICGSKGHSFTPTIPALCIGHRTAHLLFGSEPAYDVPVVPSKEPTVGTVGESISAVSEFDGWGYVQLFDRQSATSIDTFAVPEAMDPAFATGFGDLTVHEVATDPQHDRRAYLSYYAAGLRALDIQCADPGDNSTCRLVEVGGYLDPNGNDFWGVEAYRRAGSESTFILGSDRASGLWIFRRK